MNRFERNVEKHQTLYVQRDRLEHEMAGVEQKLDTLEQADWGEIRIDSQPVEATASQLEYRLYNGLNDVGNPPYYHKDLKKFLEVVRDNPRQPGLFVRPKLETGSFMFGYRYSGFFLPSRPRIGVQDGRFKLPVEDSAEFNAVDQRTYELSPRTSLDLQTDELATLFQPNETKDNTHRRTYKKTRLLIGVEAIVDWATNEAFSEVWDYSFREPAFWQFLGLVAQKGISEATRQRIEAVVAKPLEFLEGETVELNISYRYAKDRLRQLRKEKREAAAGTKRANILAEAVHAADHLKTDAGSDIMFYREHLLWWCNLAALAGMEGYEFTQQHPTQTTS